MLRDMPARAVRDLLDAERLIVQLHDLDHTRSFHQAASVTATTREGVKFDWLQHLVRQRPRQGVRGRSIGERRTLPAFTSVSRVNIFR